MERTGLAVERVMKGPIRCPAAPMVAFADRVFLTPSGKYRFITQLASEPHKKHSYHLLSVLGEDWLNSLILEEDHPDLPQVFVHPLLAKERGIQDGDQALMRSHVGSLKVKVSVSDKTRPDTLFIHHGTWIKKGGGVNRLTEDLISTTGQMAAYCSSSAEIDAV
jgi:anaerobic selenocysteine-containing dehydrogenase